MQTELENLKQKVDSLEENTDLITRDVAKVMPEIVSFLSANEQALKELYKKREEDVENNKGILKYIRKENDILDKIINNYGTLESVANAFTQKTNEQLSSLQHREQEIVAKISEIPKKVIVDHKHGLDLKSFPAIIIIVLLSLISSFEIGIIFQKSQDMEAYKSYKLRYRMLNLDFPRITSMIDSIFAADPDRFKNILEKREEEQRLEISIQQKQKEIKELNSKK